jgi:hypothetical protein
MNLDIGHPWIVDKTGGQAEVRLDLYRTLLGTCQPKTQKVVIGADPWRGRFSLWVIR